MRKGTYAEIKAGGIEAFRAMVAAVSPLPADRVQEIGSFDDVHLLSIRIDRLKQWWRPGLLCIGDAAHSMSPVGGVGINLAIQDAVAAANLLLGSLLAGAPSSAELAQVQRRRELPTRLTQSAQLRIQERFIGPTLSGLTSGVPSLARWLDSYALLRHIPARLVGLGVRPEHIAPAFRSPPAAAS